MPPMLALGGITAPESNLFGDRGSIRQNRNRPPRQVEEGLLGVDSPMGEDGGPQVTGDQGAILGDIPTRHGEIQGMTE